MKRSLILVVAIVFFAGSLFLPAQGRAQTTDVQTQIQQIMAQLQALQAQLATIQSQSVSGGTTVSPTPTSIPTPVSTTCSVSDLSGLQQNSRGSAVSKLQGILRGGGYMQISPTGFFGTITQAALKSFQGENGLSITGLVDDATLQTLDETGSCITQPPITVPILPTLTPTPTPVPVPPISSNQPYVSSVTPQPAQVGSSLTVYFSNGGSTGSIIIKNLDGSKQWHVPYTTGVVYGGFVFYDGSKVTFTVPSTIGRGYLPENTGYEAPIPVTSGTYNLFVYSTGMPMSNAFQISINTSDIPSNTQSSLVITLDSSTPAPTSIAPGQVGVSFTRFNLRAIGSDVSISSIQVDSDSSNAASNFGNLRLMDDSTQVGQTIPVLASAVKVTGYPGGVFTFGTPLVIAANSAKSLTVLADVLPNASGSGRFGISGVGVPSNVNVTGSPYGYVMQITSTPTAHTHGPASWNYGWNDFTSGGSGDHSQQILADYKAHPDQYLYNTFTLSAGQIYSGTQYVLRLYKACPDNWITRKEKIPLNNYYNYTGSNRYQEQCINDGSFDNYYDEALLNESTVTPTSTQPSINILSPNGGETFTDGQTMNIRWTSSNSVENPNIQVENQDNVGIYDVAFEIPGNSNNGEHVYSWMIPKGIFNGDKYKIRVYVMSGRAGDMSDSYITIKPATSTQPVSLLGDVNGDGTINCADVTMIMNASVGTLTLTTDQLQRADINGSGTVTAADALLLTQRNGLSCTASSSSLLPTSANTASLIDAMSQQLNQMMQILRGMPSQ